MNRKVKLQENEEIEKALKEKGYLIEQDMSGDIFITRLAPKAQEDKDVEPEEFEASEPALFALACKYSDNVQAMQDDWE